MGLDMLILGEVKSCLIASMSCRAVELRCVALEQRGACGRRGRMESWPSAHVRWVGQCLRPSDPFSFGVLSTFWKPGPVTASPWFPGPWASGSFGPKEGCSEPDLNMRTDSGRGQLVTHAVWVPIGEYPLQSFLPKKWRALCCRPVHPSPLVLALWDHVKWFWDRGEWSGQHVAQPRGLHSQSVHCQGGVPARPREADSKPQYGTSLQGGSDVNKTS